MARTTIRHKVASAKKELTEMSYSHLLLKRWAHSNNMNNHSAFYLYKQALLDIGIDYEVIRAGISKNGEVLSPAHVITLYSAANVSTNRYAIAGQCEEGIKPIWYGRFCKRQIPWKPEQSICDLEAAKTAIWIASKAAKDLCLSRIALTLYVDTQRLTDRSDDAQVLLQDLAGRLYVKLNLELVSENMENPAYKFIGVDGYQSYKDTNLSGFVNAVMP